MKLSKNIFDIVSSVFESGLDEDAFYRSNYGNLSLQDLRDEQFSFPSGSLEFILLNLLINDIEGKLNIENDIYRF